MPKNFRPELVGCMSEGSAGNPSGVMVEAAFAAMGLYWRYVNMEVPAAGLADAVRGARAMGYRGFNLSMPHKVSVIPLLDELGQSARIIGAVNTVVARDGKLIGENTDGKGFLASLDGIFDPKGRHVVLFGAGGAARAIAVELALAGAARITVVNRSEARGAELVAVLRQQTKAQAGLVAGAADYEVPADCGLIVNGTSIGLYDPQGRLPLRLDSLRPGQVAADVVFSPPRTRFLTEAAARRLATVDGLGMLVNQGVIGIRYWTGGTADAAVMRSALSGALGIPQAGIE